MKTSTFIIVAVVTSPVWIGILGVLGLFGLVVTCKILSWGGHLLQVLHGTAL